MKEMNRDMFTTPLTDRGYLATVASDLVYQTYRAAPWEPILGHIASIFYLYGAEFNGIYGGRRGAAETNTLEHERQPSLHFRYQNPPLVWATGEIGIVSQELKKLGYDMWYPYTSWPDEDGKKVREIIDPMLKERGWTPEAEEWKKKHDDLCNLVNDWHTDFSRSYKGTHDFQIKFYDASTTAVMTILDEGASEMEDTGRIDKRQQEYLVLLNAFAEYLYQGFLDEHKLFPKCKFES